VGKGGTESEKWWRLFNKLHPGFREANPEVFIPGPFWEDRVANNTYNKVFSEAMKRAELIRQRRTQSLASEIQDLLNRQRDIERQEIHQVVVDILHSRTQDSISNESLSTVDRMELESDSLPLAASNSFLFAAGMPTPDFETPNSSSASSSPPVDDSLPLSSEPGPGYRSSSCEPPLDANFSGFLSQTIPPSWQLAQDNLGMRMHRVYASPIAQASDMPEIHYCASTALTTTSSSETMSGMLSAANEFDIEQPCGKVCRCRFHSAECGKGAGDGNEWCTSFSGWFPWSAFQEPLFLH
jgi:hypothetical protein